MEKYWLNLDIRIIENEFSLKLINGKSPDKEITPSLIESSLANVQKRLDMIYGDRHETKVTIEADYMIIFLKIQLGENDKSSITINEDEEKIKNQGHFTVYASI